MTQAGGQVAVLAAVAGGPCLARLRAPARSAQMTTQEFDAAEEICRFAEPLLAPADARRR
jgi:polyhydroxybutyrate depolymerase